MFYKCEYCSSDFSASILEIICYMIVSYAIFSLDDELILYRSTENFYYWMSFYFIMLNLILSIWFFY